MKKREASVESVLPEAGAEGCRVTGPDCGRERVCSTWLQRGFKFSSHGSALTVKHRAKVGACFHSYSDSPCQHTEPPSKLKISSKHTMFL